MTLVIRSTEQASVVIKTVEQASANRRQAANSRDTRLRSIHASLLVSLLIGEQFDSSTSCSRDSMIGNVEHRDYCEDHAQKNRNESGENKPQDSTLRKRYHII